MDWHFEQGGKAMGPVSDSQLEELVRSGTVTERTLVWRQGMENWQAYGSVRSETGGAPLPGAVPLTGGADQARCAECGRFFTKDNLVSISNTWICAECKPLFVQKLREGVAGGRMKVWRQGRTLVMAKDAALPDRCVKCNVPTGGQKLPRSLYWHHPAIYAVILLNLLIYVVVALIVRKRANIAVGLCEKHRAIRKRAILTAWILVLIGAGLIIVGIAAGSGADNAWMILGGIVLLLFAAVYGAVRARIVRARRMDGDYVWLDGVCRPYLEELPDWTG